MAKTGTAKKAAKTTRTARPAKTGKALKVVESGKVDTPVEKQNGKIDVAKALRMRLKNRLSFAEIGKHFNASPQAVEQRLSAFKAYIEDPEVIAAYDESKAEMLSAAERVLLEKILDVEKLEKASTNNIAYALTAVNTMNRLERGQATSIVDSLSVLVGRLEVAEAKKIEGDGGEFSPTKQNEGKSEGDDVIDVTPENG